MEKLNNLRGVCTAGPSRPHYRRTVSCSRSRAALPERARRCTSLPGPRARRLCLAGLGELRAGRLRNPAPCLVLAVIRARPGWGRCVGVVVTFLRRIAAGRGEVIVGTEGNWRNFPRWKSSCSPLALWPRKTCHQRAYNKYWLHGTGWEPMGCWGGMAESRWVQAFWCCGLRLHPPVESPA